jgi:hypothetical protein
MGLFSKIYKKAKKAIMKPINKMVSNLKKKLKINKITAFFVAILCFAEFLQAIFKWTFETIQTITKYALAAPLCFVFWVLNSFIMFLQYIIFDILFELVLMPSLIVGKALGYPLLHFDYDKEAKAWLYEKTNIFQLIIGFIDNNLKIKFKIGSCFNIGAIKPFPVL